KEPTTAAQVAPSSNAGPSTKAQALLPAAMRRFYAPRTELLLHDNALDIAATAPNMMAALLREAACPHPVSFSAAVNARGALTLTTNNVHTPATAYAPYYEAMAHKLNQSFPIGDNPFRPFRPAPNEVQLAIHKLPTAYLPQDPSELCEALAESIRNAIEVPIFTARFLQPDPAKRFTTTSVLVSVSPNDVQKFGASIRLYSQPRRVEL